MYLLYLLDTNVLSELRSDKVKPSQGCLDRFHRQGAWTDGADAKHEGLRAWRCQPAEPVRGRYG